MEDFMKKKLLCMLLSITMASTGADSLVLAAEYPTQLQTAIEKTQGETSPAQESTAGQKASEQESTESDTEENADEEAGSGPAEENTDEEAGSGSVKENTEPEDETTAEGKDQSEEEKTDLEEEDTELQVEYHSIEEITEFINQQKADKADAVTYAEKPNVTAPYRAGALSDETLESAAAMTRQIRFIAGLPYEMDLSDEYNHSSQAAALLNYVNGQLSQEPSRPEEMPEELFKEGSDGASNAGLAYSSEPLQTINETIVDIWMADYDEHSMRGQLLKPSVEQVGFGAVRGSDGMYSAMYAQDQTDEEEAVCGVAWPAQNMPVDYFDKEYPWSVSTGETLKASDICVTLTRESDGTEWTFSENKADGLFSVDNDDSEQSGCIIFRPRTSAISEYADGDVFEVEITKEEKPYLCYRVQFFALPKEDAEMTLPEESAAEEDIPVQYTVTFESNGGTMVPAQ